MDPEVLSCWTIARACEHNGRDATVPRSQLRGIAARTTSNTTNSTRVRAKGPGNGIRGVGPKEGGRQECLVHVILVVCGPAA